MATVMQSVSQNTRVTSYITSLLLKYNRKDVVQRLKRVISVDPRRIFYFDHLAMRDLEQYHVNFEYQTWLAGSPITGQTESGWLEVTREEYDLLGAVLNDGKGTIPDFTTTKMPESNIDLAVAQLGTVMLKNNITPYVFFDSICMKRSEVIPQGFFCDHVIEMVRYDGYDELWARKVGVPAVGKSIYVLVPVYGLILHPVVLTRREMTDWENNVSTMTEVESIFGDTFFASGNPLQVGIDRVEHLLVGEHTDYVKSLAYMIWTCSNEAIVSFDVSRYASGMPVVGRKEMPELSRAIACGNSSHNYGTTAEFQGFIAKYVRNDPEHARRLALATLYTKKMHDMCYMCYLSHTALLSASVVNF